jgi:hypothetical protein
MTCESYRGIGPQNYRGFGPQKDPMTRDNFEGFKSS